MCFFKENRRRIVIWLLLVTLLTTASLHRIGRYKDRPFYQPHSDTGFFYTEEAFQYRYTRMVADDQTVPLFDKKAQWPEGLSPFRELTLFQEYLHGTAYRLYSIFFQDVPLHVFLIYFVSFFSVLSILALFLAARILGADDGAALFCAALYAFTGAAFGRIQFYELELTAFPLMMLSLTACLYALREDTPTLPAAVLSGCFLAGALIAWHFTRFYLLVFWLALGGAFLLAGGSRRRVLAAGVLLLFTAVVGVLSPVMRNSGLIVSPAMMVGGLVLAGLFYDDRYDLNFISRLVLVSTGIILIGIILGAGGESASYGHVWGLLKYKLLHLLVKPADPGELPFAGRIIWNGPFNTPSPGFLIYRYGLLLPLFLAAGYRFVRQKSERPPVFGDFLVLFLAVLFLAAGIMAQRLIVFGAFFTGLTMVYLFIPSRSKNVGKNPSGGFSLTFSSRSRPVRALLGACLIFQVYQAVHCDHTLFAGTIHHLFPDHTPERTIPPYTAGRNEMLSWIKQNTAEDAVFLAHQGDSPSILTYAGRAVNLHPKLESEDLRRKYKRMLLTLFGRDENALYRMLDAFQTDYYLYPVYNLLQTGPDGERYMAGLTRLSRNSLVYRLHFDPDSFRRLRLVYRDRYAQIFRVVGESPGVVPDTAYAAPYFPVYDPAVFGLTAPGNDGFFDDSRVPAVLDRISYALWMMDQAGQYLARGDRDKTLDTIRRALTGGLPDGSVYFRAAGYMMRLDDPDRGLAFIRRALADDPENPQYGKRLARIQVMRHEPDRALAVLTAVSRQTPDDAVVYNDMGILLWKTHHVAAARDNFLRALALDPAYTQARHNLAVLERSRPPN